MQEIACFVTRGGHAPRKKCPLCNKALFLYNFAHNSKTNHIKLFPVKIECNTSKNI